MLHLFRSRPTPAPASSVAVPAVPLHEPQRLAAVQQSRSLDTSPEERFDRFTLLAAAALQMPVATLSLLDGTREWFKSMHGIGGPRELPRSQSFGLVAITAEIQPLVVRDASLDARFAGHPLVRGPAGLRFFAGLPLTNTEGLKVGVLAVMDRVPRELSAEQRRLLREIAALAAQEIRGLPMRDTLERLAQAERRAEEHHARFAAFMENLPNIAFLKDREGRTLFGNRCHQEQFGVTAASVYGRRDDEWLPAEVATATMAADRYVIETGETLQLEEDIPTVQGIRHWLTFKFPVPTPSGERLLGGIAVDITEQKETARELQQLLALQRAIVDSAYVAIVSTDRTGMIRTFNAAAERMFGYAAAELIGRAKPDLWHDPVEIQAKADALAAQTGAFVAATGEVLLQGLQTGQVAEHEMTCIRSDGSRFRAAVSITPLKGLDGEIAGYMGLTQDITARREAEEAQRLARQAAEDANRAKSQFVANMSHEIRTPLNGILGVIAILGETALQPEQRRLAEIVQSSAESLLSIVNDTLDFSKIEANRIELEKIDFDLRATIESVIALQGARAGEKNLTLAADLAPELPAWLHGDPFRLRQVLHNLMGNAIKFSENGEIRLVVRLAEETADGLVLCFHVMDCGVGIPREQQASIFEPFAQADVSTTRLFGGTGLGLSICRQLVELMAGRIGVESEPGHGADFWFTARFATAREAGGGARPGAVAGEAALLPLPSLRVLLAEDSAINRLVATHQLRKLGCDVETVGNGRDAVEATGVMRFDLVLMDCQMPILDGYAATAAIRAREAGQGSHTRIIAVTANAMAGERERCLAVGMDGYLAKPFRPAELRELIDTVIHLPMPENVHPGGGGNSPLDPATISNLREETATAEEGTFSRYLEYFCEDAAQAEQEFAGTGDDLDASRAAAHRLRGGAANFGAFPLMALCQQIEESAADGNREAIESLRPRVCAELSRTTAALRELME